MVTEIQLDEAQKLIQQGAQVIEVLPPVEFEEGHLPGAINIPLKTLNEATAGRLDRDRPVIAYCWDYQ